MISLLQHLVVLFDPRELPLLEQALAIHPPVRVLKHANRRRNSFSARDLQAPASLPQLGANSSKIRKPFSRREGLADHNAGHTAMKAVVFSRRSWSANETGTQLWLRREPAGRSLLGRIRNIQAFFLQSYFSAKRPIPDLVTSCHQ